MTNHVPTKETCQKLKAAGFPQNTYMQFREDGALIESMHHPSSAFLWFAAPILTEILEQLPDGVQISVFWRKGGELIPEDSLYKAWIPGDDEGTQYEPYPDQVRAFDKNPAEAAALLWLELHP